MNREAIAGKLVENHKGFTDYLEALPDAHFLYAPAGKWSAGRQLDHIIRSVSPVLLACRLPGFLLRLLFGKPNRNGRSYDELVSRYHEKLRQGGRAPGRFIPGEVTVAQKQDSLSKLNSLVAQLAARVNKMPEEKLDKLLLPHPLLGKLTLREMMYFTMYHVLHHREAIAKGLEKA